LGWLVRMYWFIPKERMTEERLASLLRELAPLPGMRVPTYRPEHPEAFTLSTVALSDDVMINGWKMSLEASQVGSTFKIPAHLGFLDAAWEKADVASDDEYDGRRFLETVAQVAEGLGAVFGIYGSEFSFEDVTEFDQLKDVQSSYFFLPRTMVEAVGRDRLAAMGTMRETSNGCAFSPDGPYSGAFNGVIAAVWDSCDEILGPRPRPPLPPMPSEEERFEAQKALDRQRKAPESTGLPRRSFLSSEGMSHHFFACVIPPQNHVHERYLSFFKRLDGLQRQCGTEWRIHELQPEPSAKWLFGDGNYEGHILLPTSTPSLHDHPLEVEMDLIVPSKDDKGRGGCLATEGAAVAVVWLKETHHREDATAFIALIESLCRSLEPLYGFGHRGRDSVNRRLESDPRPESHLWTINLLSSSLGGGALHRAAGEFHLRNAHKWQLRRLGPGMSLLLYNDILSPDERYLEGADQDLTRSMDGGGARQVPSPGGRGARG